MQSFILPGRLLFAQHVCTDYVMTMLYQLTGTDYGPVCPSVAGFINRVILGAWQIYIHEILIFLDNGLKTQET